MKIPQYVTRGFRPVGTPPARRNYPVAATTTLYRGDVIADDTNGYAILATATISAATLGICAATADNSAGSAGDIDVEYFPLDISTQWIAPVGTNAVITQTIVGTIIDVHTDGYSVAINDTAVSGNLGFFVDAIDASAEAVAVNTYGYAIGHFVYQS